MPRGEPGVGGVVPLHRGAALVPAPAGHGKQQRREVVTARGRLGVEPERLDVTEIRDRGEGRVGHPKLVALVHVRGALVQVQDGGQGLGRGHPVRAVVAEPRQGARLVVVAEVQRVPALPGQAGLPGGHRPLQFGERQRSRVELVRALIQLNVLELEDHVNFVPLAGR